MSEHEEWLPVVGYEGLYEVSSQGRVRNRHGLTLKTWINQDGYGQLGLSRNGRKRQKLVHRLVCEAFHGPAPEGKPFVLHGRNGRGDNSADNLRWGSNSDNMRDRRIDGTDSQVRKTHCPAGHPYDENNTYRNGADNRSRACITCRKNRAIQYRERGISDLNDPRHGTVYGYSGLSCRCAACKEAYSNYGKEWRRGKSKTERSREWV